MVSGGRLLVCHGARWMVRAPFVVEGALTGLAAGLLAAIGVGGACVALIALAGASLAGVLPGFGYALTAVVGSALVGSGLILGALAGLTGVRRMPA